MKTIGLIITDEKRKEAFPYSDYWQTACLPVGNQPNILRTVEMLKEVGISDIYVVEKYHSQQIKKCLADHPGIHYLKSLEEFISKIPEDSMVLYIKGNKVLDINHIQSMLKKSPVFPDGRLSVSTPTKYKNASNQFGVQTKYSIVKGIYGFTREHYIDAILNGIYLLHGKIFCYFEQTALGLQNIPAGGMPEFTFYIEAMIQEAIDDGFQFGIERTDNIIFDLRYPWELLEANVEETKQKTTAITDSVGLVEAKIHATASIGDQVILGKNVTIGPQVIINGKAIIGNNTTISNGAILEENVWIGSDCLITDYAKITQGTTIGSHSKIGYTAEIFGLFFEGVSAVHQTEFFGIAGKSVDIAAGVTVGSLRFDDQETVHRIAGKRYVGKYSNAAFVGDYTRLGVGNLLFPGIKIGSQSAIGPGAILDEDVPNQTLVRVQQDKTTSNWGPNRYGWE